MSASGTSSVSRTERFLQTNFGLTLTSGSPEAGDRLWRLRQLMIDGQFASDTRASHWGAILPFQLGQLPEYFAYALAPVCAQYRKISVTLVKAVPLTDLEAVSLVAN